MRDIMTDDVLETIRNAYVEYLYEEELKGNVDAGDELSKIAMGRLSERARQLVDLLDSFPQEEIDSPSGISESRTLKEDWVEPDQERVAKGLRPFSHLEVSDI